MVFKTKVAGVCEYLSYIELDVCTFNIGTNEIGVFLKYRTRAYSVDVMCMFQADKSANF